MKDPRPARVRNAEETILDLHAEIERLRAELARLRGLPHMDRLSKDRAAIIEECARVAETYAKDLWPTAIPRSEFVAAIRALREKT